MTADEAVIAEYRNELAAALATHELDEIEDHLRTLASELRRRPRIGALAFLAPWRRRELGAAGWTLALLAPAFLGAYATVYMYIGLPESVVATTPLGTLAFACATLAGCGVIVRARWAALACVAAAYGLVGSATSLWAFTAAMGDVPRALLLARIVVGVAASLVAAVVCWRTARSSLGTLRHVLD